MKKLFIVFSFSLFGAFVFSSCGDDETCIDCKNDSTDEDLYVGNYTGKVTVNVEIDGVGKVPIDLSTTFSVTNPTAGDKKVSISSTTLDNNVLVLEGTIDASDCKKVTISNIVLDTLEITNTPSQLAGGLIKNYKPLYLVDFRGSGTGVLDCEAKNLKITINVDEGTIDSPNVVLDGLSVDTTSLDVNVSK